MFWPDLNRRIETEFEKGILPTMVYINKQNFEREAVTRPLHRHDSICELLLIYKGTGTYLVEDKEYPLEEGSVVYYNQGELHEVVSGTENEIGSYCIGITNLHKKGLPVNFLVSPDEPYVRQANHLFPVLKSLCQQMYELESVNSQGQLAAQLLCASVIVLTGQMERYPGVDVHKTKAEKMVLRIRDYLNQHFTEEITLEEVGKALGCSATYVSHIFKASTGSTPIQYVIRRRIGLAQTLLISTEYPATRIATMVGYDNTNYFSTLFSKIVGMTPIRYRAFYMEEMRGIHNQS